MSSAWLDAEAARRAAAAWSRHADDVHRRAYELDLRLSDLRLDEHRSAVCELTAAATLLWRGATFTRHLVDRVVDADLAIGGAARTCSPAGGDLGGTGTSEMRRPWTAVGGPPLDRGRAVLIRALTDTADVRQIRADEFELVRLDDGHYVVVLPGVIDLSGPRPGWDDGHRSVRDLDRAALESSRSTGIEGNRYAQLVRDGLRRAGVPTGAELLIVGHSFGADTALDLASDVTFNGPNGYRVAHVLAAGYHSDPQLSHVPRSTEVLVLRNRRDVPVAVEAIGAAHVTEAVAEGAAAVADLATGDPVAAARHQVSSLGHQVGAVWSGVRHLTGRTDDVARVGLGVVVGDPVAIGRGLVDLGLPRAGVAASAGRVVSVFDGEASGFGHRQEHYVGHLRQTSDPDVVTFLRSVGGAGYGDAGVATAIDVSVPGGP